MRLGHVLRDEPHAKWGRVRAPGATVLRRGAWYPVLLAGYANRVVLDAGSRGVALHRDLVDLRADRPARFSVVARDETDRNPVRGTPEDMGLTYAVCPISHTRIRLAEAASPPPEPIECPDCGFRGPADWDEFC
jgi:hypothetical protein